jgi:hypothetical protein
LGINPSGLIPKLAVFVGIGGELGLGANIRIDKNITARHNENKAIS